MLPHVFSGFPYVERFYSYTKIGSTNEKAIRFSELPQKGIFVFQADSQSTTVKARMERAIFPEAEGCLWVSILRQQSETSTPFLHTRAISLAIISSIKQLFPDAPLVIKWPGDILWGQKVICNLKITPHHSSSSALVISFGLNVNISNEVFPAHLHSVTTSTLIETGKRIPLSTLLRKITELYKDFIEKTPQECHSLYSTMLFSQNEKVSINTTEGVFKTVTLDGLAVIETDSGTLTVSSGTMYLTEAV
ncbi:MAG TPA: hypothetical protein VHO70_05365 [Chitinispirillaceae bacterium]|nr:hypothetical protein [Chitinispirillaceae bacterium]